MNDFTQTPFDDAEFIVNPEPRCPCILLLDTSYSMKGARIEELNAGMQQFREELASDSMAMKRIELAVIQFGPVRLLNDFHTADAFNPIPLEAQTDTPMGQAIEFAIAHLRQRKEFIRSKGVSMYKPWICLITDGGPTDEWANAARLVREGEASNSFTFFAIGVHDANFEILNQIAPRGAQKLRGLAFREFFKWLSDSLGGVSRSKPGEKVALPPPTGWASV
jgi:uncharacterized protein YegL